MYCKYRFRCSKKNRNIVCGDILMERSNYMKSNVRLLKLSLVMFSVLAITLPFGGIAFGDVNLVVISPHWEGITKEYETAFNAWYEENYGETVEIDWIDVGGTSDDLKYIESNFQTTPEGIGIDVFWGGGVDPYIVLTGKELLEPYQVSNIILDKIPNTFAGIPMYDEDYMWYGTAISGFGIVYNKQLLNVENLPEPNSWEDLTDPDLVGWVGSADPRHSGSTHMMYEIILQAYGWEKGLGIATLMGANVKTFPESSSAVPKSVGASDIAYGLAIDFYAWAQVDQVGSENIGYVMPEGLTVLNPDSIGILKGAPNLEVAQRFVEFILSNEGQKMWLLPVGAEGGPTKNLLGRMSVIPELYDEVGDKSVVPINPFEIMSSLEYDADLGSSRWSFINDLIGATIIDTHGDLVTAWEAIISAEEALENAGKTSSKLDEAKDKMIEAPLTWEEAVIAMELFGDAEKRNEYISEWHSFAATKYNTVKTLASEAAAEAESQPIQNNTIYLALGAIVVIVVAVFYYMRSKN
jgi:ABC-type Fe3+ transport system substrate-binding protein